MMTTFGMRKLMLCVNLVRELILIQRKTQFKTSIVCVIVKLARVGRDNDMKLISFFCFLLLGNCIQRG